MPSPTTYEKIKSLEISAFELKSLMGWPDPVVEDYINMARSFLTISQIIDSLIDKKLEDIPTDFEDNSVVFIKDGYPKEANDNFYYDVDLGYLGLFSDIGRQLRIGYSGIKYSDFQVGSSGDLHIYASGGSVFLDNYTTNGFLKASGANGKIVIDTTAYLPASSYKVNDGTAQGQFIFWDATAGKWTYTETGELFWDDTNKRVGVGTSNPSAILNIKAGTASAGTAPIKLTSGTLLTTPEAGALEYLTNVFYIRGSDGLNVAQKVQGGSGHFGDASNYASIGTTGNLSFNGSARIAWTKYTANSVNITTGGTDASSVVANLQTENDGNIFHLDEAAATPGLDFYVEFTNVTAFNWVRIRGNYVGSATHAIGVLLYDWASAAWRHKECLQSMAYNTTAQQEVICNSSFFVASSVNYIGSGGDIGKVRIRFVHPMAGNNSHDIYLDSVELYQ